MAYNLSDTRTISAQTSDDLSGNQFQFVKLGTDNLIHAAASGNQALGILENIPSAPTNNISGVTGPGQYACTVSVDGVTRIVVDGAYSIGQAITPGSGGVGTAPTSDATMAATRAILMQQSYTGLDIVSCRLVGPYPVGSGVTGYPGV